MCLASYLEPVQVNMVRKPVLMRSAVSKATEGFFTVTQIFDEKGGGCRVKGGVLSVGRTTEEASKQLSLSPVYVLP